MESHIINIVRFATCITIFVVCIILMFKADDNNLMRRLSAAFGVIFIFAGLYIELREVLK